MASNTAKLWPRTAFTSLFRTQFPIMLAPMAGPCTPDLVAAVSNAGGLGSFGLGAMSSTDVRNVILSIKAKTSKPFMLNFQANLPKSSHHLDIKHLPSSVSSFLEEKRRRLGVSTDDSKIQATSWSWREMIDLLVELEVGSVSVAFDTFPEDVVEELEQKGVICCGTVTCARDVKAHLKTGVRVLITQGSEAGGHRGMVSGSLASNALDSSEAMVGLGTLIPVARRAVEQYWRENPERERKEVVLVAGGGIATGEQIVSNLVLGADAVSVGTAFLATKESGAKPFYKQAIYDSSETDTAPTRVFTGRLARGIKNAWYAHLHPTESKDLPNDRWMPQHISRGVAGAGSKAGEMDSTYLWAGQGVGLMRKDGGFGGGDCGGGF